MIKREYSSNLETAARYSTAVVIEFGHTFVRVGIAEESKPRVVLPLLKDDSDDSNSVLHSFYKLNKFSVSGYSTATKLFCIAEDTDSDDTSLTRNIFYYWLNHVYTNLLLIKPKSRRVIMILPLIYPSKLEEQLQAALLDDLGVPSVYFTHAFQTVPYAIGSKIGIIVDVGHRETRVAAYFDGIILNDTLQIVPTGCASGIHHLALQRNKSVEQISDHIQSLDEDLLSSLYGQYLFDIYNHDSVMFAFLKTLHKCSIDLRRQVLERVCFVGGGVQALPNIEVQFLKQCINLFEVIPHNTDSSSLLNLSRYRMKDRFYARFDALGACIMSSLGVVELKFQPTIASWVGGSIMGSLKTSRIRWIDSSRTQTL